VRMPLTFRWYLEYHKVLRCSRPLTWGYPTQYLEQPDMPRIRPLCVSVQRIMASSGQVAPGRISRDRGDGTV